MQRALMHYFKPCNRALVLQALKKAGREDLIGWGPECLIPPRRMGAREGAPERQDRGKGRPARGRTEGSGKKTEGGRGRSGGRPGQSGRNRKHAENGGRR